MDEYAVEILNEAWKELEDIYLYIAKHFREPGTADAMVSAIEDGIYSLEHMPHRNPERRHGIFANRGYRQLFVKNYTIVYRIDESTHKVLVVAIRYSRSNF